MANHVTNTFSNNNSTIEKLSFFYTNATSLVNKWDAFNSHLIFLNYPHVVLITETWFNETSITNLDNYHLYDKRRNQCRGGGVAVYIRNDIVSNEITDKTLTSNKIEQIWCNIKTNRDSILIGCIYRPPTSDNEYNKSLDKILSRAKSLRDKNRYSGTLIVGDFNYPDIQWSNIGGYYNESIKKSSLNFLDNICSNHFSQHVIEPTLGTNFLDLVLTDDPSRIFAVNVGPPLGQSNKMKLHSSLTGDFLLNGTHFFIAR